MRKLLVLVMVVGFCFFSPGIKSAKAGGIPVFDGVGLAQSIMGYVQNLMDYMEQLSQLSALDNQYATQLQQYARELEEYQHYLNQVQRMADVLSAADWNQIMQDAMNYYGEGNFAAIPNIDVTTTAGRTSVGQIIDTAYYVPDTVANTVTARQAAVPGYAMPAPEQAAHARNHVQMQKLVDRQYMVAQNQQEVNGRMGIIDKYKTKAEGLGNDSDLETQHLMAEQMAFLLQQQEIMIGRMNQILSGQETFSEFTATQDAAAKNEAAAQEAKHRTNNLPSTLGTNIWKTF